MTDDSQERGGAQWDPKTKRHFVRIRLPNKQRRRFWLKPGISDAYADEQAAALRERIKANPAQYVVLPSRRTMKRVQPGKGGGADWWNDYMAFREEKGLSPVRDLLRAHIEPVLGDKHPKDWTPADCERLRDALDDKISAGSWVNAKGVRYPFGWKRAWNVWSLFTMACKTAAHSKNKRLRVRADNPCRDIEPPDRGSDKQKQWLYPEEFVQLVTCEDVPLRWRRFYALLVYSYVRASELKALRWADVDLKVGTIHVTKAWSYKTKKLKDYPKSDAGVRYVPIEPELVPLLEVLKAETGGTGLLFPWVPPMEDWADKLREHLQRAGIMRAALFEDTVTVKNITLHDLRATGITWRCLRRDYGPQIQTDAGHEKYDTTDGYIRAAGVFVGRVGDPFPRLPAALLRSDSVPSPSEEMGHQLAHTTSKYPVPLDILSDPSGNRMRSNERNQRDLPGFDDGAESKSDQKSDPKCAKARDVARAAESESADPIEALMTAIQAARAAGNNKLARALGAALVEALGDGEKRGGTVVELVRRGRRDGGL